MIYTEADKDTFNSLSYMKSSFPKGVRSILESSEKNDVFLIIHVRKVAG